MTARERALRVVFWIASLLGDVWWTLRRIWQRLRRPSPEQVVANAVALVERGALEFLHEVHGERWISSTQLCSFASCGFCRSRRGDPRGDPCEILPRAVGCVCPVPWLGKPPCPWCGEQPQ